MTQRKSGKPNPDEHPNQKNYNQNCRYISPERADFITYVLGAWVILLICLCGYFLSDHSYTPGMSLLTAAVIALIYAGYIILSHKVRKSHILSITPLSSYILSSGICLGVAAAWASGFLSSKTDIISAQIITQLSPINIESLQDATPFIFYPNRTSPRGVVPAQIMLYMSIENAQSTPIRVTSFHLESAAAEKGPWTELCPISVNGRTMASIEPIDKSAIMLDDNFLDFSLIQKTLEPHRAIEGWSAWQCAGKCATAFFRAQFQDGNVLLGTDIISAPSLRKNTIQGGAAMHVTGQTIDLSDVRFESACSK